MKLTAPIFERDIPNVRIQNTGVLLSLTAIADVRRRFSSVSECVCESTTKPQLSSQGSRRQGLFTSSYLFLSRSENVMLDLHLEHLRQLSCLLTLFSPRLAFAET
ncbi:hypothetical protein JTE90_023869 [Oedothorax gibbosus]|uniref:Uncharacterized protein n=1 Tax=Oedothorax gibbosus TaxID=931172 RepID=A0AAV6ULT3_9ARAC|nr:hypothetical protein JTE90_023869 [Oedothorax gibbosus]